MGPHNTPRAALLLCVLAAQAACHGDEHMDMGSMHQTPNSTSAPTQHKNYNLFNEPNYASLEAYSGLIMAHIGLEILAWFFVLPFGVMFSIARSKLALPIQLSFVTLNGLAVVCGTVYNINTPDLYANNAHHKIGWIATWVFTAQVVMSLLFLYSGRSKQETTTPGERAAFLPPTLQSVNRSYHKHRWSGDSGQGTEPSSPTRSSRTLSPNRDYDFGKAEQEEPEDMEEMPVEPVRRRPSCFKNTKIDKYLSTHVPKVVSQKMFKIAEIAYEMIDRTILVLGFIVLTSGVVTYSGIFRGLNVFNGLAHWVKGGIFFWYGLLTLGRWLGSFADFGWAWNLKPTRSEVGWKARVPTAEFVESFVIFLYGCINVFLEHLAAWGGKWVAQDLEHVSISIMFFGGGLAGMLVESKRLRAWLNTNVDLMPSRTEVHPEEAHEVREHPKSYSTSLNIMPALVILLLGIMMSAHHQDSMVSTTVHTQWGTLLAGFSLCRGTTYLLNYLSPPKTIYPSRPPTELAASFCLISGGLVFMLSTKDIIHYMEVYNLMAMFVLTVVMGFTAFLMAYTILVIALKGWAVRREQKMLGKFRF